MAMSIRVNSPNVPIQLIHDNNGISSLNIGKLKLFDYLTEIKHEHSYNNTKVNPSKAKVNLYNYLIFDKTIYLDVDGIVIKPLDSLFDRCDGLDFATQIVGTANYTDEDFVEMQWAEVKEVYEKYNLPKDKQLPATNSSFMYIKQGSRAKQIFETAIKFYNNPIDKLKLKWGKGSAQPDELYFNASLCLNGFCNIGRIGYFNTKKERYSLRKLIEDYYFLGLWGNKQMNSRAIIGNGQKHSGYYNKLTLQNGKKIYGENYRIEYHYYLLEKFKFYNQK